MGSRFYRSLLILYPAEFRNEYGSQMEAAFADRLAGAAGTARKARIWMELLWDILRSAPAEHLDVARSDVRYGFRSLRRSPAFALTVIAALAAGIGVNTAIFSVVYGVLLKPLPYPDSDRLVSVTVSVPNRVLNASLGPDFPAWRNQSRLLDTIAIYTSGERMLVGPHGPQPVIAAGVTRELFPLLGVQPLIGPGFVDADSRAGAPGTVLISHAAWQLLFSGDAAIVGREIALDAESFRIAGVLPPGFSFPGRTGIWYLNREDLAAQRTQDRITLVNVIGKLRKEVTRDQVEAELTGIARSAWNGPGVMASRREMLNGIRAIATPLNEVIVGNTRPQLLMLVGAVALVLAIACVNAANLMLARAATRYREVAVRLALGAGQSRLIRHVLTQSLLLAGAAGVLGTALAFGLLKVLTALQGATFPRGEEVGISWMVLGFTAALSTLTGLVFGFAPAAFVTRTRLNDALKDGARSGGDPAWPRLRSALVAAQLAVALVLMACTGLMTRSFMELRRVNPGFEPGNLLIAEVTLLNPAYSEREPSFLFHQEALRRLAALPGVQSAGLNPDMPINSSFGTQVPLTAEGYPSDSELPLFGSRFVNADYFRTLGIPLLAGRMFTEADVVAKAKPVIVNAALARLFFTPQEAVGKRLQDKDHREGGSTIVGVVGNVRHRGLHEPPMPEVYTPYSAVPLPRVSYAIRTKVEPEQIAGSVRAAIRSVDANAGVHSLSTMEERIQGTLAQREFQVLVLVAFALVAAGLAALGVYGVVSYAVGQRTHEIGVRMALGASAGDIVRMVVRQVLTMACVGIGVGLAATWWSGRALSGLLFSVQPSDPIAVGAAAMVLIGIAALGSFGPAWRASKVDPALTLRRE